jgi:hypothetical protein
VPRHPPCALSSLTIKFTQNNKPEFDVSGASLGSKGSNPVPFTLRNFSHLLKFSIALAQ